MAVNIGWEDVLEFIGTSGFTLGFDRLLRGELGTNLKKGYDDLRQKIEERAQHQVVMWNYVRNNLDMEYSAPLIKVHRDAQSAHQYMRANRIETTYTLVYITFEDVSVHPEAVEREQKREQAFQELARAARDNLTEFNDLLDAYERQGLRTYLLVAKQLGLDVWRFIGKPVTAIAEAIGGEGAVEKLKMYFENPERWGPDLWHYRNTSPFHQSVRVWMDAKAENLRLQNEESKARARERHRIIPMAPDSASRWARAKQRIVTLPPFVWPFIITGVVIFVSIIIGYAQK